MTKKIVAALIAGIVGVVLGCNQVGITHTYSCWLRNVHRGCDGQQIPDFQDTDETVSATAACAGLRAKWIGFGALPSITCDPKECTAATPVIRDYEDDPPAPEPQPQAMAPDPTDLTCASSCPNVPATDPCQSCAASYCCALWTACQSDANCQCWIACVAATGSASTCAEEPGTDPNGAVTCGPKGATTGPLDGCLLTSCVAACGVTPPAPPPAPGEGADGLVTVLGGLR